ncbi:hypothetical protein [Nostoc parmelioides]|uniref:Transketolase n=1 Tax=Nostoc parmelioides FACHB-3921 TaxID=2692909 RepID=A0ABR8BKP8_9NOSO|nr:hypothetical protein [Nostoc parmelioides]MBD2253435.1 hypothetical protein [Nostoc parmelioides FACHB-3921]
MSPLPNHAKATKEKHLVYYQFKVPASTANLRVNQYLILFLSFLTLSITNIYPATAHKVQISPDVGATLHIEPNDNPRAGEPTQAWFALTRKGGTILPLQQCNCQLTVYAEPHTPGEPALLEPSLKPVNAERYQGIPGADITFPKPGIYQLQLSGKPTTGANFKPFEFTFEVTVAGGNAVNTQNSQDVNTENSVDLAAESNSIPPWAIAVPILAVLGVVLAIWHNKNKP